MHQSVLNEPLLHPSFDIIFLFRLYLYVIVFFIFVSYLYVLYVRLRGRPRESIVTTLNKDINRVKSMNRGFPIPTLRRKEDFEHIRSVAQDRKAWRKCSDMVCRAAEAETI